ncbi:MAG: arginine--tRNA ligase, partial [Chitinophagaceae bacterium]
MNLVDQVKEMTASAIQHLYSLTVPPSDIVATATKPEFSGDYTIVLFALTKKLGKATESLGQELGSQLTETHKEFFTSFNVIKGFLNL